MTWSHKYILFCILLLSCKTKLPQQPISSASKVGMVVSAHPLATQAGLNALKKGGNAMDAAIAAYYTLAVVYPRAGNLGGGGFAVVRSSDGEISTLDFREKAPMASHRNMYLDKDGNVIPGKSLAGGLAVGVPGSVAGMHELQQKYAKLAPEVNIEAARVWAEKGFGISKGEAQRLNQFKADFVKWNTEDIPFIRSSEWKAGDRLSQPKLASTLGRLQEHGASHFYSSDLAKKIIDRVLNKGGILSLQDFGAYEVVWRDPVHFSYKGHDIYSMPPPSSGGITLGQIMGTLESQSLNDFHSTEDVHLLVEAERRAFADRSVYLGDPDFVLNPVDQLLDPKYIQDKMQNFDPDKASSSTEIKEGQFDWSRESFETTHLTVADSSGMVVSITTTLNSNFGSKVFVPELGFFLNNEMDDFSAKPGVPNQFGLIGNDANAIEPEKRMLSSMTPTIIEKDGDFFMALGTPGGSTIITTVAQVILNIIDYQMDLPSSVSAPRFHHQWWPDVIMHEKNWSPDLKQSLKTKGHQLKELDRIGLVEAININEEGYFVGASDPRGEGVAKGL